MSKLAMKNYLVGLICSVIGLVVGWIAGHHRVQEAIDMWTEVQTFIEEDQVFGNELSLFYAGEARDEIHILLMLENQDTESAREKLIEHLTRHYLSAMKAIEIGDETQHETKLIETFKTLSEKSKTLKKIVAQKNS